MHLNVPISLQMESLNIFKLPIGHPSLQLYRGRPLLIAQFFLAYQHFSPGFLQGMFFKMSLLFFFSI